MSALTPAATVAALIEIINELSEAATPAKTGISLPGYERPRHWSETAARRGWIDEDAI